MADNFLQPADLPIGIGDIVDKYRVERVLGVGAMGVVVSARHLTLDQVVAIKFLLERSEHGQHGFGSREESIARFASEARAAAKIESDHVCRVSDVGTLRDGMPYMIMEHLEGNDLEDEIVHRGQLGIVEAVDYVLQALDAIAAAHQLGIVHRDLKPANLFLARRPDGSRRVKVLDFGISKARESTTHRPHRRFTLEKRSLGTPAYMPPEQINDPMNVDHRVDIWALGCILYEALTGQMAFVGNDVKEVLDRVLAEDPCPIPSLRRDVPPELIALTMRALRRDRDERFSSAARFAQSLAFFGSIGVLSSLASIQREVGSLSSISSTPVSSQYPTTATPSVEPMVIGSPISSRRDLRDERSTEPDPSEVGRRHVVTHDWTRHEKRRRQARSVVLAMVTSLLLATSIAILVYRHTHARMHSGVTSAAEQPPPPPFVETAWPPPLLVPTSTPAPAPAPTPTPTPALTPAPTPSASTNVQATPNSVHSTRNGGKSHPARSPNR